MLNECHVNVDLTLIQQKRHALVKTRCFGSCFGKSCYKRVYLKRNVYGNTDILDSYQFILY